MEPQAALLLQPIVLSRWAPHGCRAAGSALQVPSRPDAPLPTQLHVHAHTHRDFSHFDISQEEFETLATGAGVTFCSREGTYCTLGLHAKWRPSKALPSTATCPQEWKKQQTTDTEEPHATVSEPITWAMAVPWKKVPRHSCLPTHLLTASLRLAHQALPADLTHYGNPPKCSH